MKTSLFAPLLAAAYASAHGFVPRITIDGQTYQGDSIGGPNTPSVIRQVTAQDPIYGATNANINCGNGATIAANSANANPGSQINFFWTAEDGGNWPHDTGPMLTYMASCGDAPCSQFDSTTAKWFKIQEVGRRADGLWTQKDVMGGAPANITLPSNIAPGNYLVRHEIIALHLATTPEKAEFYESCSQLVIGGNGNGTPSPDELVSLPGAYSDTDPGILVDAYDPTVNYVFPGPPIAAFVSGGAPDSSPSPNSGSGSGSGAGSPTAHAAGPTSAPSGNGGTSSASTSGSGSGSCHLKKKVSSTAVGASATGSATSYKPRHLSRVMRDLVFGNSKFH
ncbi:hypothetical protein BDN72DRAFT_844925 [Pluteus cervinus]|uniref:Uncharacterized protein n=1 Tax=Pluteus cervinus TaxID=181527 RepID=A0ACD3AJJ9_9AGAR|nr:hypothetical protein BDN72DRAFT_844925 [Pluteus cervinus]